MYEPLKADHGEEDLELTLPSSCTSLSSFSETDDISMNSRLTPGSISASGQQIMAFDLSKKDRRNVSFDCSVHVHQIPSRFAYSNRVKQYLWNNIDEFRNSIERNIMEFSSENWDWRQVADDSEFYLNSLTGEKIHPVHIVEMVSDCQVELNPVRSKQREEFLQISRRAASRWNEY
eukprot:CAMPEP_0184870186 /NCGR_PEP_ID=MMETSP0580-20130426/36776_1 /TAXON_ID=1118495 /ORGANISM="Dactyliosolen fragilissimus" /LENGTH=175 /DNA_ID=CAMNT_0027372153 /DNA_START=334 /DNA_END=861 /DNA_ORIENTATION=-